MKIKYVKFESESKDYAPWNQMTFYDCKVLNISIQEYKAGKRMSIEIEAPKLRKKFYLFAWSDQGICDAIEQSSLRVGDYISCHCELSYYQNKDGRHCEAYKIVPNVGYDINVPENDKYFKLMVIKREDQVKKPENKTQHLTKDQILNMMLG